MKTKRLTKKEKNRLNQNNLIHILWAVLIVVVVIGGYTWYKGNNQNATSEHIKYIKSFMSSSGQLRDYSNKLGMRDPKTDLKWYQSSDEIAIHFGRIILTWSPEIFLTDTTKEELNSIGLDYQVNSKTNAITVYYKGEVVERWVD